MRADSSTAAVMKRALPAPTNAKDALGEIERAITEGEGHLADIGQEIVDVQIDADAETRAFIETQESELRFELARLNGDTDAARAKVHEIQSKFSFVIGTVTERTEHKLPDLSEAEPVTSIRRAR